MVALLVLMLMLFIHTDTEHLGRIPLRINMSGKSARTGRSDRRNTVSSYLSTYILPVAHYLDASGSPSDAKRPYSSRR